MTIHIDHVTIAGSALARMQRVFAEVGLETDYGGLHSNGATHMALLGFADGSYVELISTFVAGTQSPLWGAHIAGDGGPCGWAVATDDPGLEAARLKGLGVPVRGPFPLNRRRADGALVEWDLVYVGDGEPGATLPFLIKDRTPREWRVQPSASVAGTELTGVAVVVLGVDDLATSVDLFRRVYGSTRSRTRRRGRLRRPPGLVHGDTGGAGRALGRERMARAAHGAFRSVPVRLPDQYRRL